MTINIHFQRRWFCNPVRLYVAIRGINGVLTLDLARNVEIMHLKALLIIKQQITCGSLNRDLQGMIYLNSYLIIQSA